MNTQMEIIETDWARDLDEVIHTARLLDAPLAGQNSLGSNRDFFAGKSLTELAREQGVGPVEDISVFAGGIPEDEDVDEMLDEIYRLREP